MAANTLQNCQRGLIFMIFLNILAIFVFLTIRLIKKLVDKESSPVQSKYKQGTKETGKGQSSNAALETKKPVPSLSEKEETPIIKVIKKVYQMEMLYLPIMITFPLNLVTGTSKAFCIVDYFFIFTCVVVFNILKLHRSCIEHKVVRMILETLWLFLGFFMLLNVWSTTPALQPYQIVGK